MKQQLFFCLSSALCIQSAFSDLKDADANKPDWAQQKSQYKGQPFSNLVLSNKNLNGIDLSGCEFTNVSFCGTKLQNSNLTNVSFNGCDMTGVDLTASDLTDSKFDRRVVLNNAILTGVNLKNVDLSKIPRKNLANIKIGLNKNSKDIIVDFSTRTDIELLNDYNYLFVASLPGYMAGPFIERSCSLTLQRIINCFNLDLSNQDLSQKDLSGFNLSRAILTGAKLIKIKIGDNVTITITGRSNQEILNDYNLLKKQSKTIAANKLGTIMTCLGIPIS